MKGGTKLLLLFRKEEAHEEDLFLLISEVSVG